MNSILKEIENSIIYDKDECSPDVESARQWVEKNLNLEIGVCNCADFHIDDGIYCFYKRNDKNILIIYCCGAYETVYDITEDQTCKLIAACIKKLYS